MKKVLDLKTTYSIDTIEQHLLYHYLTLKGLNYSANQTLEYYFKNFTKDNTLIKHLTQLNLKSIKNLENCIETLIPIEDRKLNGAFFTPTFITNFVITFLNPKEIDKIFDPSCGCGAFLIEAIEYLRITYKKKIGDIIRENIYGCDILDYNVKRAKLIIVIYALEHNENLEESDINIRKMDTLLNKWNEYYDIIIGNPPYVKIQDLSDLYRSQLISKFPHQTTGNFNLYQLFFELGHRLLTKSGKLGYITPNNYITSLTAEGLRTYFQTTRCVHTIIDFKDHLVFDAQTYTCLTFINKETNNHIKYQSISKNDTVIKFLSTEQNYSQNTYSQLNAKKWRLSTETSIKIINHIENCGLQLGQLFDISTGIATLKDSVYTVTEFNENNDGMKIIEGVIYTIEKAILRKTLKLSQIKTQSDIDNCSRYFIFPYEQKGGRYEAIPEEALKLQFPQCYAFFKAAANQLSERDKGKRPIIPFYAYGRGQGLNKKGIKLATPTFSLKPNFLTVLDENMLFTNGYALYYKDLTNHLFNDTNPIAYPEYSDVLAKILNSKLMEYYIDITSVKIKGGYSCYQKNFIERFCIPNLTTENLAKISKTSNSFDTEELIIDLFGLSAFESTIMNFKQSVQKTIP